MCSIETLRVSNGEMDVLTFGEGGRPMLIIPGLSIKSVMLSAEIVARSSVDIADRIGCDLYMYEGYAHSVFDEAPDYKSRVAAFFDSAY